jgi:hypothetical protein
MFKPANFYESVFFRKYCIWLRYDTKFPTLEYTIQFSLLAVFTNRLIHE